MMINIFNIKRYLFDPFDEVDFVLGRENVIVPLNNSWPPWCRGQNKKFWHHARSLMQWAKKKIFLLIRTNIAHQCIPRLFQGALFSLSRTLSTDSRQTPAADPRLRRGEKSRSGAHRRRVAADRWGPHTPRAASLACSGLQHERAKAPQSETRAFRWVRTRTSLISRFLFSLFLPQTTNRRHVISYVHKTLAKYCSRI